MANRPLQCNLCWRYSRSSRLTTLGRDAVQSRIAEQNVDTISRAQWSVALEHNPMCATELEQGSLRFVDHRMKLDLVHGRSNGSARCFKQLAQIRDGEVGYADCTDFPCRLQLLHCFLRKTKNQTGNT